MAEPKTKQTNASVTKFLNSISDPARRADCFEVMEMMEKATGEPAKMWGPSIVGFGTHHYKYASGREGETMKIGFSPRKTDLTLYVTDDWDSFADLTERLGKYKTGKSCLYIKKLDDVDRRVLKQIVNKSVKDLKKNAKTS